MMVLTYCVGSTMNIWPFCILHNTVFLPQSPREIALDAVD